ncbi:glycoside hydrolase superfamily [Aspergillus parasiticus]|uniref:Arabinogalactan endo-beta-1,4-galactanase n=1 Tax=Aspergillus parasiticus TaxID=5067 RepID=A0A5N6DI67_ASPPA|nr:glycoside hydrolase superfamily [Aspergillus parasiticus]
MQTMLKAITAAVAFSSLADPLQYVGVDWSSVLVEERGGVVYKNAQGTEMPLENILVEAGVNMVRQRVWTVDGDYGIQYNLELAQRANKAGLLFGLNLHYSDTWTNPDQQAIPTGWPQDIESLITQLYNYTTEVCETFAAEGLYPETITIGNEIPSGLLWPTGYYTNPENLARLLQTAASAVKNSSLGGHTKVVTHLAHGWNSELQHCLATQYQKEVQVVETNWPTQCSNPEYPFPQDQLDIPFSSAGQITYLQRLADTLKAIPAATGLNYWEPAWIDNAVLGTSCESNVMFDTSGQAYDSVSIFGSLY